MGLIRTALFNWAHARHTGGTFVFRIEDTDAARDSEQSYQDLLDALSWLGLDWDEGPEVGGPYGPYRQSQRGEVYRDVLDRLRTGGWIYESYSTPEEIRARRVAAGQAAEMGYDNADRDLTPEQRAAYVADGRAPVWRLRMPDRVLEWDDVVRGPVRFEPGTVPDFVVARANGEPLYTLVNPVDDALMRITHVLRGEDLLPSTPRQLAMYMALADIGVGDGSTPSFGHLPYVMGEGNRKLSKRDPQSSLGHYRDGGYLPEALLNYLALLGWSPGGDVEFFSLEQMAQWFDITKVQPNPARFDVKKCLAINGDWIRQLSPDDLARRLVPFLQRSGSIGPHPSPGQLGLLAAAVPLVQERMGTLVEGAAMLHFIFVDDENFHVDDADRAALDAADVLVAARLALTDVGTFDAASIEAALRTALIDGLGLKPKLAFTPVRVAVSGRRVSPPLFESLELLGRERSLSRLKAATAGS